VLRKSYLLAYRPGRSDFAHAFQAEGRFSAMDDDFEGNWLCGRRVINLPAGCYFDSRETKRERERGRET